MLAMSVGVCAWISALSSCSWSKLKCVCRSFLWLLNFSALLPHLHFQNCQITSTMPLTNLSNPVLFIYNNNNKFNSFWKFGDFFSFLAFFWIYTRNNENFQIFPKLFLPKKFPSLKSSSITFHYPFTPNFLYLQLKIDNFMSKYLFLSNQKVKKVLNWTFQIFNNQKNKYIECTLYFQFILKI